MSHPHHIPFDIYHPESYIQASRRIRQGYGGNYDRAASVDHGALMPPTRNRVRNATSSEEPSQFNWQRKISLPQNVPDLAQHQDYVHARQRSFPYAVSCSERHPDPMLSCSLLSTDGGVVTASTAVNPGSVHMDGSTATRCNGMEDSSFDKGASASMQSITSVDSGYTATPNSSRTTTSTNVTNSTSLKLSSPLEEVYYAKTAAAGVTLIHWWDVLQDAATSAHCGGEDSLWEELVSHCTVEKPGALSEEMPASCWRTLLDSVRLRRQYGHLQYLYESFLPELSHVGNQMNRNAKTIGPVPTTSLEDRLREIIQLEEDLLAEFKNTIQSLQEVTEEIRLQLKSKNASLADRFQRLVKSVTNVLHLLCLHGRKVADLQQPDGGSKVDNEAEQEDRDRSCTALTQAQTLASRILLDDKRLRDSLHQVAGQELLQLTNNDSNSRKHSNATQQISEHLTRLTTCILKQELTQMSLKQDRLILSRFVDLKSE